MYNQGTVSRNSISYYFISGPQKLDHINIKKNIFSVLKTKLNPNFLSQHFTVYFEKHPMTPANVRKRADKHLCM